ncbi:aldehyde reductase [Phenylobacterium aquaticum]|uniref:SDR family oxidoreductase n=1 Tax=Phenylobacterium aquaticum TaxID=1763816 RepID=UPI0026EBAEF5|nr:aldehyde reductase [Phenylobacterium aquaticum]
MSETVLVTGGTGFVAGWTIVELLRRGYRVRTTVRSLAREAAVRRAVGTEVDPGANLTVVAADLTADAGWDAAVAGCAYVLHIASPLGGSGGEDLISAARDGTLRVLSAAVRAGVKRVVMTSSTAACTPAKPLKRAIDETDWTDPDQPGLAVYRKSKVLAEKAAWDFMADHPATSLTTILPGAIFGPVLTKDQLGSVAIIQRLLQGQPPALPRLGFNITDVRDLADLHIRAMTKPEAAGQRFIAMGEALWYAEVAATLKARLGEGAAKVTTANMPDLVARTLALASPQMKAVLPLLGRTQAFSTTKARDILGYAPRPARDTVADCGASLLI